MSGEGVGYLLALPILIGGVAIAGMGMAAYGVVKAGAYVGQEAYSYYKKKKEEKEEIIKSGIRSDLGMLQKDVEASLQSMDEMGNTLYSELQQEMMGKNSEILDMLQQANAQKYQEYLADLQGAQQETYQKMEDMQKKFNKDYADKVKTELATIKTQVNTSADAIVKSIKDFVGTEKEKEEHAKTVAKKYLDETEKILNALLKGFDTERLLPGVADSLEKQLKDAGDMFHAENYQGAIATAQTLQMDIAEKMYDVEKADIDWDVAYRTALSAAEMVKTYLESQESFSEEAAEEIKKLTGIEIPEELYDEEIAEYSDRDENGRNIYLESLQGIQKISGVLEETSAKNMSVKELQNLTEKITTVLYPQALQTVQNAVMNMSNVFYRAQKANEFADFLEDKDFEVRMFWEDEDNLTSPLGIAVYNPVTKEKVVYTLSKQKPGEHPNKVNILYQLADGDAANQARNDYYQDLISQFTGAPAMTCNTDTIGMTAAGQMSDAAKKQVQLLGK